MTKWMQMWQFGSQGEQSIAAVLDTCQTYGFDGILVKALDGTWWMGQIDGNPDAISGPGDVARWAQAAHDRGMRMGVWDNPLQTNLNDQADMIVAAGNECDAVAFDTEPYAGFWGVNTPGWASSLMERVHSNMSADVECIWQPDGRPQRVAEVGGDEWAPHMTTYAPQDYWSDFYFTPTLGLAAATMQTSRGIAQSYGLAYCPTLPGNASQDTFPTDEIGQQDGFVVWRLGSIGAQALQFIGALAVQQGGPVTSADCQPYVDAIAARDVFIDDIADRLVADEIGALLQAKTKTGHPAVIDRKKLQDIVNQVIYERTQIHGPRGAATARRQPLIRDGAYGNIAEGSNKH